MRSGAWMSVCRRICGNYENQMRTQEKQCQTQTIVTNTVVSVVVAVVVGSLSPFACT